MSRNFVLLFGLFIFFSSCRKEKFPDDRELQGTWIEQTDNSAKSKLIFDNGKLDLVQSTSEDAFYFRLDNNDEMIWLTPNCTSCCYFENNHKMELNKRNHTLSIWGLFPNASGQVSETKFKKE